MSLDLISERYAEGWPGDGSGEDCTIRTSSRMIAIVQNIHPFLFLLIATTLEVSGDALVRMAIYKHVGLVRIALVVACAVLLLGYGFAVNLAPLEFGQVVGLYIATLFIVWQVINLIAFRTFPNLPIVIGGTLIIAGGLIVTFWNPEFSK
ncbi:MAG TPA: hypothetical protein VNH83_31380 [Bryobacteraceae bacterium]|nr:hypothetical protein [Bryobacteraceae bacterium]